MTTTAHLHVMHITSSIVLVILTLALTIALSDRSGKYFRDLMQALRWWRGFSPEEREEMSMKTFGKTWRSIQSEEVHILYKQQEQYSQTLEIQFTQYNVGLLDGFHNGDRVRVTLGVNGRKTEKDGKERVFNSLNGFGIAKI